MENLLNKVSEAGLDPSAQSGENAIIFWNHVRKHIASTPIEKANCYIISSDYRQLMHQPQLSIDELHYALNLLSLPDDAETILLVKVKLSERLIESGQFQAALQEFVDISNISVSHGYIDSYAHSLLGMGDLCRSYGDYKRALKFYQLFEAIDHAVSSRSLRLTFKLAFLDCFLQLGRLNAAENLQQECEDLAILVSNKRLSGLVSVYFARLSRTRNKPLEALKALAKLHQSHGTIDAFLACQIRMELCLCLMAIDKSELAYSLLSTGKKRLLSINSPSVKHQYYQAFSDVCTSLRRYEEALNHQKKSFQLETDLLRSIPIMELGSSELRRLSRFELQLKLILSEIENKELKETTEQHKNKVEKLTQDVHTDPMTHLFNRRWMDIKLKDLLLHQTPFTLLVIDIDHFKSINDELGHLIGDQAIVTVAEQLTTYFKFRGASCVRFGGEEFLVLLEKNTPIQANMHAERLRENIELFPWQTILGERGLTVSIGLTDHRDNENTQRTFYRADKALYRAKANGRNQVCSE